MEPRCLVTKDSPIANGRIPAHGERMYVLAFPLDDDTELHVCLGQPGIEALKAFIRDMRLDDFVESVLEEE